MEENKYNRMLMFQLTSVEKKQLLTQSHISVAAVEKDSHLVTFY